VLVVFYFPFNLFLSFYFTFIRARRIDRATCSVDFNSHASWCAVPIWRARIFCKVWENGCEDHSHDE